MNASTPNPYARTRWIAAAIFAVAAAVTALLGSARATTATEPDPTLLTFADDSGVQQTLLANGADPTNPFFQDLGTNGRTCNTCHRAQEGWTVTPAELQVRFNATDGLDPIFHNNDGTNCEGAAPATVAERRSASSLLLSKGLIRVGMSVPGNAEFQIVDVDDPYNCGAPFDGASLYRRPLPAGNLGFLSTVMWDGRETTAGASVRDDLISQARDATMGHAQGPPPSSAILDQIVDFESASFTAQAQERVAGSLTAGGATGGPLALSTQPFCVGVNDPLNMLPSMPGACATSSGGLNPNVFTIFDAWASDPSPSRQAIARGQQIFNTRTFTIDNVAGLNGGPTDPVSGPMRGTCTVCHDTPNAGNHSVSMALNIGIADASRRTLDLPLYTLQNRTTGDTVQTTDIGRAMVTGKWADIGKFKGPTLRALATRAPYFHNGSAATLADVVEFYETRFHLGLTAQERSDLLAFLGAL